MDTKVEVKIFPQTYEIVAMAQKQWDMECMKQLEPYMQLDTHTMIGSMILHSKMGSGEIKVVTPYAKRRLLEPSKIGSRTGTKRGYNYINRMKADKIEYLKSFLKGIL